MGKTTITSILPVSGADFSSFTGPDSNEVYLLGVSNNVQWLTADNGEQIGDNRRIKVCSLENNSWALLLKSEMDIRWMCCSLQQGQGSLKLFWWLMF